MALSDRIAEAITGSGKSKADVARACKVTNAAVTHWINGSTQSLKAETALALEEVTGYRAYWLLHGRGTKTLAERYWPFSVSAARFDGLNEKQKGYVDARLEQAIEQCEGSSTAESERQRLREMTTPLSKLSPRKKRVA